MPQAQDILDSFIRAQSGKSPNTILTYRPIVQAFLDSAGDPPWTTQDVLLHLNEIASRNAETTVALKATVLQLFFRWCQKRDYCDDALVDCCVVRQPAQKMPRTATSDELAMLLRSARPQMQMALLLAGHIGLRESEIRGLRWLDINLIDESVAVLGKGNKLRHLPITSQALLTVLRARQAQPMEYVVPGRGGQQITRCTLGRTLKLLCEKCGLRTLNMHSFRHCFASESHLGGVPLRTVQGMLGHGSIQTTERYLSSLGGVEALRSGMQRMQTATAGGG